VGGLLVWMDLEMSGLDPEKQVILEIASLITDNELEIISEGPNIVIHYPEKFLETIDEWSRTQHTASGLLEKVKFSVYDCRRAEQETLNFVKAFCAKDESPLCGNSIGQDRRFLKKYMPDLEEYLHYRNIDVSTIKELVQRWYPDKPPFIKQKTHLALNDIRESIQELKHYRKKFFITRGAGLP
jgi:oligoribonuclease